MFGYAKMGKEAIEMMKKPIGFDKRNRQFITLMKMPEEQEGKKVMGSKGAVYYVHNNKCTCPGFKYRGECKHV